MEDRDNNVSRKKSTKKFAPKIPSKPRVIPTKNLPDKDTETQNSKNKKFQNKGNDKFSKGNNPKQNKIVETAGVFSSGVLMQNKGRSQNSVPYSKQEIIKRENITVDIGETKQDNLDFLNIETDDKINVNSNLSYPVTLPLSSNINMLIDGDSNCKETNSNIDYKLGLFSSKKEYPPGNGYFLFQLPDMLSLDYFTSNYLKPENDQHDNLETADDSSDEFFDDINKVYEPNLSLNNIDDGNIGKLQLMKSGEIRMCLGNQVFHLENSVQCCFLQELFILNEEYKSNDTVTSTNSENMEFKSDDTPINKTDSNSTTTNKSDKVYVGADLGPIKHSFVCFRDLS